MLTLLYKKALQLRIRIITTECNQPTLLTISDDWFTKKTEIKQKLN